MALSGLLHDILSVELEGVCAWALVAWLLLPRC
jgi:hypothetical protein